MLITTVIHLKSGILTQIEHFENVEKGNDLFRKMVKNLDNTLSEQDIEDCLDYGHFENMSGDEIIITSDNKVNNFVKL